MDATLVAATSTDGGAALQTPAGEGTSTQTPASRPWMAQLPKDLLDDSELSQHEKLENLARSWKEQGGKLKELQTRLEKSTSIPGQDAKQEDWDKFYASIGRPEKPDGYQFKREGDLEKVPKFDGMDEWTAQTYHQLGLTKAQAEALWAANGKKSLEILASMKAQNETKAREATQALEAKWGRDYAERRANLEKSVNIFFGEKTAKEFFASPLANNVEFVDRLAGLAKYMSDAQFHSGAAAGGTKGRTAGEVIFPELAKR